MKILLFLLKKLTIIEQLYGQVCSSNVKIYSLFINKCEYPVENLEADFPLI